MKGEGEITSEMRVTERGKAGERQVKGEGGFPSYHDGRSRSTVAVEHLYFFNYLII